MQSYIIHTIMWKLKSYTTLQSKIQQTRSHVLLYIKERSSSRRNFSFSIITKLLKMNSENRQ